MTWATKSKSKAFTTKINNPIVMMIKGMLSKRRNGLTKALMIPSSSDAPKRAPRLEQLMPGITFSAAKTATVVTIHRMKKALTIST